MTAHEFMQIAVATRKAAAVAENLGVDLSLNPAAARVLADWLQACAEYMVDFPDYTHDGEDFAAAFVKAWKDDSCE